MITMDQLFMYHSLCYTGFITECSSEASQGKLFQVVGQFLFKMSGLQPPSSRVAYNFHNVPLCPEFSQNFQGRCTREDCKYLHPPPHLKTQLEINGKHSIAAQKMLQNFHNQQLQLQAAAAASMQLHQPGATILPSHQALSNSLELVGGCPSYPYDMGRYNASCTRCLQSEAPSPGLSTSPAHSTSPAVSESSFYSTYLYPMPVSMPPANQVPNHINMYSQYLTPTNAVAPNQLQDFPAPGQFMTPNGAVIPFVQPRPKNDKLEVCREFQRGNCSRAECKFAHPAEGAAIDQLDNTVTVCMDYIKGRCSRDKCKYFHPPAHLQTKIKAAQHQANQASVAAVLQTTPETISKKRAREPADDIILNAALPGLLPPAKKGVAAGSHVAHHQGMFQHHPAMYQQALASMQMNSQPSHYIPPPIPMMPTVPPGATAATMPFYTHHQVMAHQHSADTIPVCRDFKSGSCKRPNCRYAHVMEDQVEIVEGKVTMCRDAVKGKCARANCKYYHNASSSASNTNASTTVAARATTLVASCSNLAAATMAAAQ
ncbi:muscleblind-like protein 1 isoform X10 [Asterias rubens]|uniref:muscleblind-like protein 1 isoform X10 n=1 Tax=Asterias rubens TaxID=7604 RepID=UPI001455B6A7|nr:muscleblind-like protein 1 isoform X10 [Asterias rubens]